MLKTFSGPSLPDEAAAIEAISPQTLLGTLCDRLVAVSTYLGAAQQLLGETPLQVSAGQLMRRALAEVERAEGLVLGARKQFLWGDTVFAIGPFEFRPLANLLTRVATGERIKVSDKEAGILTVLYMANAGTVARDVLMREVWNYRPDVESHTLETHIYRLRRKLTSGPADPKLVLTEEGGYRLAEAAYLDPNGAMSGHRRRPTGRADAATP